MVINKNETIVHGSLPANWTISKLGDVGTIVTGNTPKTSEPENYGHDFLWVSPIDMGDKKYINQTKKMLTRIGFDKTRKVPQGSILVTCIGSTIGKIGIASKELSTNQQINTLIVNEYFHNEYIYYAVDFNFHKYESFISNQAVPIINKTQFSQFTIPVPPLSEQRKIAAILTSVDDAIDATQRIIDQTEVVKRGLMQQLLTRGIGHTTFKQTEIGEIPTEWDVVSLGDLVAENRTICYGVLKPGDFIKDGIPLVRIVDIKNNELSSENLHRISVELDEEYKRSKLFGDEILISLVGTIGRIAVTSDIHRGMNVHRNIGIVPIDRNRANKQYVAYYLQSAFGQACIADITKGGNQPLLNLGDLKGLSIPVPLQLEQQSIVNTLSSVDHKIAVEKRVLRNQHNLKFALMQVLLTGKVRVNVDEPSEVSV